MKKIVTVVVFVILSMFFSLPSASAQTAPTISFSSDLNTVSVSYSGKSYIIPRPITPQTTFTPATGGRYRWVAKNGNDSNSGTEDAPYLTIGHGLSVIQPGDVLIIKEGVYEEAGLVSSTHGTSNAPIVITAAANAIGKVKIKYSDSLISQLNSSHGIPPDVLRISSTYTTVNGLVLEGPMGRLSYYPSDTYSGIAWYATNGKATNNTAYYNYFTGIVTASSSCEFVGNILFANGYEGEARDHGIYIAADNNRVIGNILFDNTGYGIHIYSGIANTYVVRNITFGNHFGGIVLSSFNGQVYNNVSYDNLMWGISYFGTSSGNNVRNNIIVNNRDANCHQDVENPRGGNTDDNNIYHPNSYNNECQNLPFGPNNIYADPLFVDPAHGDFRLKTGSPAIGKATNVGLGYNDLGAYPFSGSTSVVPSDIPTTSPTATLVPSPTPTPLPTATPTPIPCPKVPTNTGTVSLNVTVPVAGTYTLWSRIMAPDTINDSFWVQIDNACPVLMGNAVLTPLNWHWINYSDGLSQNIVKTTLTAGTHTLKLTGAEPGVMVDRLILTTDSCLPTETGDNCLPLPTATPTPTQFILPTFIPTATPIPTPTSFLPTFTPPSPTSKPTALPTPSLSPSASGKIFTLGTTTLYTTSDRDNATYLNSYRKVLTKQGIVQSLSIYIRSAGNAKMYLGIYSEKKGRPDRLMVKTGEFRPKVGWNTVKVTTPVKLSPGAYYLVFQPNTDLLVTSWTTKTDTACPFSHPNKYGSLPTTFPRSPYATYVCDASFYATFTQ